jgi:hypothetical protein
MPCADDHFGDEGGMALPVAVFALVVIGGIVAGHFLAGVLEQQSGRNTLFVTQAAEAAEAGLVTALSIAPASTLVTLEIGGAPLELGPVSVGSGSGVERQVSRLTEDLFLVRSRGTRYNADGVPLATRAIGLLVRLAPDSVTGSDTVVPLTQRAWVQLY